MKMKAKYLSVLVFCWAVCSCMEEQEYPGSEPQSMKECARISVSLSDDAQLPEGAVMAGWKPVGKGECYEYVASQGGVLSDFVYSSEGDAPVQVAYALYPSVMVDSLYRGSFYFPIKPVQEVGDDGYDADAMVYAGHVTDGSAVLHPLTGKIGFRINQDDVAVCRISTKQGNALAGPVKVLMKNVPLVKSVGNSNKCVEVHGDMEKGKTYYAVVAAEDYSILDLEFENSFGVKVFEKTYTGYYPLSEGGVTSLGDVGNPDVSSFELKVGSGEFEGYLLKQVTGYSAGEGIMIMSSQANAMLEKDGELSVRFFGLEPKDYSEDKLWYVFTLEKDGVSRVLPVEIEGMDITAGTVIRYDIGDLSESMNAAPWYYPYEDTRLMAGAGYAYGDANTYLIQYKESTYNGATLDPDASIPSSVTIDYRLRGDLFASPRPENVTFEWLQGYDNTSTPSWGIYTMDRTSKITNCDSYTISVDEDDYEVTVTNTGAHAGAPILLMKKDGKVLWAWTFWNIAADGTRLQATDFGGVQLANMTIGHASTIKEKIVQGMTEIRRSTYYYQWGRPIPTFSASGAGAYFSENDSRNVANPRVPVCDLGPLTVEEALEHPGYLIQNPHVTGTKSTNLNDWIKDSAEENSDLWGGTDIASEGVKSIYDPCPKGWRVADAKTYMNVCPMPVVAYSKDDYPQETMTGYHGVYVEGVLFPCSGYYGVSLSATTYAEAYGLSYGTNRTSANLHWTNTFHSGSKAYSFGTDYFYKKYDSSVENTARTISVRDMSVGNALPVRCQVDKDCR